MPQNASSDQGINCCHSSSSILVTSMSSKLALLRLLDKYGKKIGVRIFRVKAVRAENTFFLYYESQISLKSVVIRYIFSWAQLFKSSLA